MLPAQGASPKPLGLPRTLLDRHDVGLTIIHLPEHPLSRPESIRYSTLGIQNW